MRAQEGLPVARVARVARVAVVAVAILLPWEHPELEDGIYLEVGERPVRGGGEMMVAVVSYARPYVKLARRLT